MVNVLLAASPATRSRPRAIKGQEPGLVDVLLQPPEQTRSRRGRAEVVNELLWVAAKRTFTSPGPWPLVHLVSRVVNELLWVAAKRTFTSPGPWPLNVRVRPRPGLFNFCNGRQLV